MRQSLVVVAGGTGTRMGLPVAKQFVEVEGSPLMWWTLRRFRAALGEALDVTLVLHESLFDAWMALEAQYGAAGVDRVVAGGAERFHSVRNGLAAVPAASGVVGIHDAVRPFVPADVVRRCYDEAARCGSAVPVVPLKDSIRALDDDGSHAVSRDALRAVQTPQCFDLSRLRAAYAVAFSPAFTDDASVWEAAGASVHLVAGDPFNLKVTTPEDLIVARAFLREGH
jgi:2-C-methyl-D-erythritol 4-phosphate cytidylyltransferase